MGLLLNLKNLFNKEKIVKQTRKSINRIRAEEELKIALEKNKLVHLYGGARDRDLRAVYIPRRGKFKGYMRENKRCSFNKNR
jgi:hypothetical protein